MAVIIMCGSSILDKLSTKPIFVEYAIGRAEYSFVVSEAAEPKAVKTWPVAASPSPTLVTLNSFHADFSSHLSTAEELDSLMSRLTLCSSHTCVTGLRAPWCFYLTSISGQIALPTILEKGEDNAILQLPKLIC